MLRCSPGGSRDSEVNARAQQLLDASDGDAPSRVLNATGVLLHTNLGRAPLPVAAREAVHVAAEGYGALELDLESGRRGSRQAHVESLLCELTGADAALVVNNGAAAVLLAVAALAGQPGRAPSAASARLPRGADRDRRWLPDPGGGRPVRGTADGGGDDQPHARGGLPRRDQRPRGVDPSRAPIELPHSGVRRAPVADGAVCAGAPGRRRSRLRRARTRSCGRAGGVHRRTGPAQLAAVRGGPGLLLRRQAARRTAGRTAGRLSRRDRGRRRSPAGPGGADRQALAGCAARDAGSAS